MEEKEELILGLPDSVFKDSDRFLEMWKEYSAKRGWVTTQSRQTSEIISELIRLENRLGEPIEQINAEPVTVINDPIRKVPIQAENHTTRVSIYTKKWILTYFVPNGKSIFNYEKLFPRIDFRDIHEVVLTADVENDNDSFVF